MAPAAPASTAAAPRQLVPLPEGAGEDGGIGGIGGGLPFVPMLVGRLRQLPDQSFEINLLVTACVAALVELPHVYVHTMLLGDGPTSIMPVLEGLSGNLDARAERIDNLGNRLLQAREALQSQATPAASRTPLERALVATVVLEEFVKELAALVHVHSNRSLIGAA